MKEIFQHLKITLVFHFVFLRKFLPCGSQLFVFDNWPIKENKRNRIRNLANTDNPFLLSNGQGVVKFKAEIFSVNTHIDPLFIKKSHYKTLIKYRS